MKRLATHPPAQRVSRASSCPFLLSPGLSLVPGQSDSPFLITTSWITILRVEYYTIASDVTCNSLDQWLFEQLLVLLQTARTTKASSQQGPETQNKLTFNLKITGETLTWSLKTKREEITWNRTVHRKCQKNFKVFISKNSSQVREWSFTIPSKLCNKNLCYLIRSSGCFTIYIKNPRFRLDCKWCKCKVILVCPTGIFPK